MRKLLPPLTREPPKLGKLVSGNPAAVPLPLGGRLKLPPTIRSLSVGRGFEEVYQRAGQEPKSVPHKRRTKTPLCRTKKGSALFALPSLGTYSFFWGVLGELEGTFPKVPSNNPAPRSFFPKSFGGCAAPFPSQKYADVVKIRHRPFKRCINGVQIPPFPPKKRSRGANSLLCTPKNASTGALRCPVLFLFLPKSDGLSPKNGSILGKTRGLFYK